MARRLAPRYLIALDFSEYGDEEMHNLVNDIKQVAPQSPIVTSSQPLQTSLASLITKDDALTASNKDVATDRAKLSADLATAAQDRTDLQGELRTYATLLVGQAKSPQDLAISGMPPAPPRPA